MRFLGIKKPDKHDDAKGKEEDVSFFRVSGSKMAIYFHHVNEISLRRIYAPAWSIMKQWRLSFLVHVYLQLFFHFQIAPEIACTPARIVLLFVSPFVSLRFCSYFCFVSFCFTFVVVSFFSFTVLIACENHLSVTSSRLNSKE